MKNWMKVLIVLLGYLAAIVLGVLAWWANDLRAAVFNQNSPGMVAEGDSIACFMVTGLAAIFPTALALFFLRPVGWFWSLYTWAMLLLALAGIPLEITGALLHHYQVMQPPWELLSVPVVIWTFTIPFTAPADILSALIAPDPKNRRRLLIAFGVEAAMALLVAFRILFENRFM